MKNVLRENSGMLSVEAAIVMSVVCLILTMWIVFYLTVFEGISDICSGSVGYTGFLPPDIHRVTTVIIETGGDIIEKIS